MRYLYLLILVGMVLFGLPRLLRPSAGPSDSVIKEDFYFLMSTTSFGSARMVRNPYGWVEAEMNANNVIGRYRVRIADFKIIRKPAEISIGTFGVRGEKIYSVEIYKTVEREYNGTGDTQLLHSQLPKTESSRVRSIFYKTKEGKWAHTPGEKF